jgi:alanyl-tRNA synthetase
VLNRNDIKQAGSYVDEDYGRLDFNADKPLTLEQIRQVENLVNEWIRKVIPVEVIETSLDKAISLGAKAFFDEKYGEIVRVIKIP